MSFGYNPVFGKMLSFESSYRKEKKQQDSFLQKFGILQRRKLSETRCTAEGMPDVIRELNEYHPDLICLRRELYRAHRPLCSGAQSDNPPAEMVHPGQ